jgi:glucuronokinase
MAMEGRCAARAALAGNPSDGFGGAVLATVVPGLEAVVTLDPADGPRPVELPLLVATRATLRRHGYLNGSDGPLALTTTIPRSVGLAGSSAVVIAAIRALIAPTAVSPLELAHLALEVEVEGLGIAAGPQDRIVQAEGRTVLMDFATDDWVVTPVDPPRPIEVFIAWTHAPPIPSHAVHGPLQARSGDPLVRRTMARLSEVAHVAARALRDDDVASLRQAMDDSVDQRAGIIDLDPTHVALVDGARAAGAAVNYTGSGGAIVGHAPDLAAVREWTERAGHGFRRWSLEGG